MTVEKLRNEGLIEPISASLPKAVRGIRRAQRDFSSAQIMLPIDEEWTYTMAYHAMLRAGRALMAADGYRPKGKAQHRTVVVYVGSRLGSRFRDLVSDFDRMRRKRHEFVYDFERPIPHQEAEQALKDAQDLVGAIASLIRPRRS